MIMIRSQVRRPVGSFQLQQLQQQLPQVLLIILENHHSSTYIQTLLFSVFIPRDAFIVGICNSLTSVFAGVVVFAILGNLANGRPIGEIVSV